MNQLQAGVAKVNITPPVGTYLQGYSRGKSSVGILDDLHARALVFDNGRRKVALVAADLLGLDEPSVKRIRELISDTVGIPGNNVMLASSHTHCGPAVMDVLSWTDPPDENNLRETERKIAGAVTVAAQQLQPVRLAFGQGMMDYNINRRREDLAGTPMSPNPKGAVDRSVKVLRVQADGKVDPLAVVFLYACHATSMGGALLISAEHPGAACSFIEEAYDGATTALYLQGCTGNLRPNITDGKGHFAQATPVQMQRLGRRLGAETVRVCETLAGGDRPAAFTDSEALFGGSKRVRLPFASLPTKAELKRILRDPSNSERGWAQHVLNKLNEGRLTTYEPAEVQVLRIGNQRMVGLPGEPFVEIGWRIEERLPAHTFVAGYTNAVVGYLCTADSYSEGGYEPATSYSGFSRPAPFTPEVERLLVNAAAALARLADEG